MLAGYKRNNRFIRKVRHFQRNGLSASEYANRVNHIKFNLNGLKTPRDLRLHQYFKMHSSPIFKEWYKTRVSIF